MDFYISLIVYYYFELKIGTFIMLIMLYPAYLGYEVDMN